ncbi:hypothetical protein HMPREF1862_00420 [Varibaculum cambriense]|uniref:Uncharacterized protein n=1 Tax=Varibaculum cambriense TaxID=184870 RepID=A0AB34X0X1_9ACTO|nr:hypothetical protein HMPREF1862_00420 [Varibaculum cambriense]
MNAGDNFFLPPKNSEKDRRHFPNSYALSLSGFLFCCHVSDAGS